MRIHGGIMDDRAAAERKVSGKGGYRRPWAETVLLVASAATITVLNERRRVPIPEATRQIARASGFPEKTLTSRRDNIIRHRQTELLLDYYRSAVRELLDLTEEEFDVRALELVANLSVLCPDAQW